MKGMVIDMSKYEMKKIFGNYVRIYLEKNLDKCMVYCKDRLKFNKPCNYCNNYDEICFNCYESTDISAKDLLIFLSPNSGDILSHNKYISCESTFSWMCDKFQMFLNKEFRKYGLYLGASDDGIIVRTTEKGIVGIIKEFSSISDLLNQIERIYQKI